MSQNFEEKQFSICLGKRGEDAVANMLKQNKFKILATNYQKKFGEVDIIAKKDQTLVFVEVKTRRSRNFPIFEIIVKSKQKKIILTAKSFILENNLHDNFARFDVAFVSPTNDSWKIDYIPNAFSQEESSNEF